jgi:hypothetical protein
MKIGSLHRVSKQNQIEHESKMEGEVGRLLQRVHVASQRNKKGEKQHRSSFTRSQRKKTTDQ